MRKFFEAVQSITQRWLSERPRPSATPRGRHPKNRLQRFEQLEQRTLLSISPGAYVSEGISALNIDDVHERFLMDGTGVRVGVIADGLGGMGDSQGTDDLPDLVTYSDLGDGTTGTAMLEVIHDAAPGASLYFAPASTEDQLRTAGQWLADVAQVNIIVVAAGIYEQPWFQDGLAASDIDADMIVISAAGDDGEIHYQADFSSIGLYLNTPGTANGWHAHNFGNGSTNKDLLAFNATGTFDVYMEWSDPWGSSDNNYNLYLFKYNTSTSSWEELAQAGNDVQNGAGNPWEQVQITAAGTYGVQVALIDMNGVAREFELIINGSVTPITDSSGAYGASFSTADDAFDGIFGPAAVDSVITVGTVNVDDSGLDTVAAYSSRGPSTVYESLPVQTASERDSLDGVAVDKVSTRVLGTNGFSGTAAAAAHAAGGVALMVQADLQDPDLVLSAATIQTILRQTAVDIEATGRDDVAGYGRFDALEAAYFMYTPGTPDLAEGSDFGASKIDNITSDLTPTFTGAVPPNSWVTLEVMFGTEWELAAEGAAAADGQYSLTFDANTAVPGGWLPAYDGEYAFRVGAASGSTGEIYNYSESLPVTIDTVGPAVSEPDLHSDSDSGSDPEDDVTRGETPRFTGTASDAAGSYMSGLWKVEIREGDVLFGTQDTTSDYDLTTGDLTEGTRTITATAYDVAGNSTVSTGLSVVVDRTDPTDLDVLLDSTYDTGLYDDDEITNETHLRFTLSPFGTGSDIDTVVVNGETADLIDAETGEYEVYLDLDTGGMTPVLATVTDMAGNEAISTILEVTVDQTVPVGAIYEVVPNPRHTDVPSVTLDFGEIVDGLDLDDLTLTLDGAEIAWPETGVTLLPTAVVGEYELGGVDFAGLTADIGTYVLTLDVSALSEIEDRAGNLLSEESPNNVITWDRYGYVPELTGDNNVVIVTTDGATHHVVKVNGVTTYDGAGTIYIDGSGGTGNRVSIYDSADNDTFVGDGTLATMDWGGGGIDVTVTGFSRVDGYSSGHVDDMASLVGSELSDNFYAYESGSYMREANGAYLNFAIGFANVTVDVESAPGGTDRAFLYDTAGPDTFVGNAHVATMDWGSDGNGEVFDIVASGFTRVNGYSSGHMDDMASLVGSELPDRFYAYDGHSYMRETGGAYLNYAIGFANASAQAGGGNDNRAYLYDSVGDDMFEANPESASMDYSYDGAQFAADVVAYAFQRVYADFSAGDDIIELSNSLGADVFYGRDNYGYLKGAGSSYLIYLTSLTWEGSSIDSVTLISPDSDDNTLDASDELIDHILNYLSDDWTVV